MSQDAKISFFPFRKVPFSGAEVFYDGDPDLFDFSVNEPTKIEIEENLPTNADDAEFVEVPSVSDKSLDELNIIPEETDQETLGSAIEVEEDKSEVVPTFVESKVTNPQVTYAQDFAELTQEKFVGEWVSGYSVLAMIFGPLAALYVSMPKEFVEYITLLEKSLYQLIAGDAHWYY